MMGPAREWEERRQRVAARRPRVRVDRCLVRAGAEGTFEVVIEGFGLVPAFSPPHITIGGVLLERMRVEQGGRRLTGTLAARPRGTAVEVDLGYIRTVGKVTPEERRDVKGR